MFGVTFKSLAGLERYDTNQNGIFLSLMVRIAFENLLIFEKQLDSVRLEQRIFSALLANLGG